MKPNPLDFRALPINDADLIPFYIGSDTSKPFWVKWGDLKKVIESLSPPAPPGSAAWGSIATGTGVGSQTDLVAYLTSNYYPLSSNPAGYITSPALTAILANYVTNSSLASTLTNYVTTVALSAILSGYVTSGDLAIALTGYVPTSRTITINGVTFDLSANRSWTVSTSAVWGAITGLINNQTDLINFLSANYQPIGNYVPSSRTITINGIAFDLSADRSWTISASSTIAKTTALGTAVTGTTSNVISQSLLVPADSIITGSIPRVVWRISKTGTGGTFTARYYVNTVNSLVGATLLGFSNTVGSATTRLVQMQRSLNVRNNITATQVWSLTTNAFTDIGSSTAAGWDTVAVAHNLPLFHIFAIQNTVNGDSTVVEFASIENV